MTGNRLDPDSYRKLFQLHNGREPSLKETNDALRLAQLAVDSNVDPFLLLTVIDARIRDLHERVPGEIDAAGEKIIGNLKNTIPSGSELAKRLESVRLFGAAVEKFVELGTFFRNQLLPAAGVFTALFGILLLVYTAALFRLGYDWGTKGRDTEQSCEVLAHVYSLAHEQRHTQTQGDVRNAYIVRCPQK